MRTRHSLVAIESLVIAGIGIADLATTLVWVHTHGAREANPVFAHYLEMGPVWFCLMKLVLLAAPIFVLEWARRIRPGFTRRASRLGIAAYLTMYVVGVVKLNPQLVRPRSAEASIYRTDIVLAHRRARPEAIGRHPHYGSAPASASAAGHVVDGSSLAVAASGGGF